MRSIRVKVSCTDIRFSLSFLHFTMHRNSNAPTRRAHGANVRYIRLSINWDWIEEEERSNCNAATLSYFPSRLCVPSCFATSEETKQIANGRKRRRGKKYAFIAPLLVMADGVALWRPIWGADALKNRCHYISYSWLFCVMSHLLLSFYYYISFVRCSPRLQYDSINMRMSIAMQLAGTRRNMRRHPLCLVDNWFTSISCASVGDMCFVCHWFLSLLIARIGRCSIVIASQSADRRFYCNIIVYLIARLFSIDKMHRICKCVAWTTSLCRETHAHVGVNESKSRLLAWKQIFKQNMYEHLCKMYCIQGTG